MDISIRSDIADWILGLENEELLETLRLIKEEYAKKDWYSELDENQRKSIDQGLTDHENGRTLGSKEFWLKHGR